MTRLPVIPSPLRVLPLLWMVRLLLPMVAFGQEEQSRQGHGTFGVAVEYDFGAPLDINRAASGSDWCPCDGRGISWEHSGWIGGSYEHPTLFAPRFGLAVRAGAGYSSGKFTSNDYITEPFLDPSSNRIISALARFDVETAVPFLRADAAATFAVAGDLRLSAGTWIRRHVSPVVTLRDVLLAPADARFPENHRQEIVRQTNGTVLAPPWSAGLFTGVSLSTSLSEDMELGASLAVRVSGAALRDGAGWRAASIGFGVAVGFGGREPSPRPGGARTPIPLPVLRLPNQPQRITAAINLFSTGPNGEKIHVALVRSSQHYYRQRAPLLPLVCFEKGGAQIPSRYLRSTRELAAQFSARSLISRNAVEQYYRILDVIGLRMSEHPEAVLTLTGAAGTDEPPSLGTARAEAVAAYLRSVWNVRGARLRIESKGAVPVKHAADARSVTFASTDPAILDDIVTDWMVERFQCSPVNLLPAVNAADRMRDWTITLSHEGREIARYTSGEKGGKMDIDVGLLLSDRERGEPVAPLVAQIAVEDSTGTITTATDALSFMFPGDTAAGADVHIRTTTTFVLPNAELTASTRGTANRDALRDLADRAGAGDRIIVSPLLERSGGALATEQQIQQDVQHVANALLIALGKRKVSITLGRGLYSLSDGPPLPEMDVLSPLVSVTLERDLGPVR